MTDTNTAVTWRVAHNFDGKTHRGRHEFESQKAAAKAASRIQALSSEAGFGGIYYAEPATVQADTEDAA